MSTLYDQIINGRYRKSLEAVLNQPQCDIDGEFLGFVDIYEHLAEIIPLAYTVIDLGCAYAPQAYYFRGHKKYIGVDIARKDEPRVVFMTDNMEYHDNGIEEFLENYEHVDKEFAICSYVPNSISNNMTLAKEHFQNVFTYYPCILNDRSN